MMRQIDPVTPPHGRFRRLLHLPPVTLLVGLLIVGAVGILYHAVVGRAVDALGLHGPVPDLLVSAGGALAVVLGYRLFDNLIERRNNVEFALPGAARELLGGIAAGVALFSAVVAVIAAFGGYRIVGWNDAGVLLPALAMAISSGVIEEVVFRGLLFRLVERWLGSWIALAVSAALFGGLHLGNPNATLLATAAIMLEAGVLLAAVYMLTRRLWAAIGLHGAWNFAQGGLYGIRVSGIESDGLIRPAIDGPTWLTGGTFGAEASLPAILLCSAAGIGVLLLCIRRGRILPPRSRTPS